MAGFFCVSSLSSFMSELSEKDKKVLEDAVREAGEDWEAISKAVKAWKKDGTKGLMKSLPNVIEELKDDKEIVAALGPIAKAGYKTTEFWLVVGVLVLNGLYPVVTGKALPIDANVAMSVMVSVYSVVRGFVKGKSVKEAPKEIKEVVREKAE